MSLLKFLILSLRARGFMVLLTTFALFLSLFLLLFLEKAKQGLETHFQKTVGGVHLLVGPRGSELELLLQGFFFQGSGTTSLPENLRQQWQKDQRILEIIPFALGDSYRGYPVVAIENQYFQTMAPNAPLTPHQGELPKNLQDVLLGWQSARQLNLKLKDEVWLTHGVSTSPVLSEEHSHEEMPFTVCGILPATGTALDRALFIPLDSFAQLHHLKKKSVNGFYVRLKDPRDILNLKWELTQYKKEPLTAILPVMSLANLRQQIAIAESVLRLFSFLFFLSSLFSLTIFIIVVLRDRLREMAILRALGASRLKISLLVLLESYFIYTLASLAALSLLHLLLFSFAETIFAYTGFPLLSAAVVPTEIGIVFIGFLAVSLIALLPVILLYRRSLAQGLQG